MNKEERLRQEGRALQASLYYAEQCGWAVLPVHGIRDGRCTCGNPDCAAPGKHPLIKQWQKLATSDPGQIRKWWKAFPDANVGVLTGQHSGGLVVVDIDGPQGEASSAELELPHTLKARTGSGGSHLLYRCESAVPRKVGYRAGIDVLGEASYFIAPPSRHISGGKYTWIGVPPPDGIRPAPPWLHECGAGSLPADACGAGSLPANRQAGSLPHTGGSGTEPRGEHDVIRVGERKMTLVRFAGALRHSGLSAREIGAALREMNERRCRDERGNPAPLPEEEIRDILRSARKWKRGAGRLPHTGDDADLPPVEPGTYNLTELGNAERLAHRHGHELRWVQEGACWAAWDGTRWRMDERTAPKAMAQETVRHIYAEASAVQDREARRRLARHAERSEQARAMRAMLSHAEPMLVSSAADFDADPWLLNVPNGTLELRAGTLRPHRREDRLTKLCPVAYHPEAKAPRWEQFLGEVFQGNAALISFLQRWVGYTLTGDSSERKFVILHGPGKNGKSTFVETLRFILGSDYAAHANSETFLRKRLGTIPADLASLQGKRLVTVAETGEGRSLDAATIKTATGRDRLKVRLLHHNFFEYTPQFKLYLSTNHKPDIPADDQAVWDRVRLIPFRRTFEEHEQDKHLDEKLRSEAPGILAWAVQGCLQWQKDGLAVPDTVTAATLQYRSEMDVIAQFLQDCCVLQPSATVRPKQLHEAYATWCAENAEKPLGLRKFGENVKRRGYRTRLTMGNAVWDGLGLRLAHECA